DQIAFNLPEPERRQKEPVNPLSLGRFIVIHRFRPRRLQTIAEFLRSLFKLQRSPLGALCSCWSHQRFSLQSFSVDVFASQRGSGCAKIIRQLAIRMARQNPKLLCESLAPIWNSGRTAALHGRFLRLQLADGCRPNIACRTRAELPR